jgi:N-acetylglucosamine kinase-like BadF-type ATPase
VTTCDQSFYLGLDGGGSKTLAIIVNEQRQEVGRGLAGSSNYAAVGLDAALKNIYAAVAIAAEAAHCTLPFKTAWLGLAGVDRPADRDALAPHLSQLAHHVRLTNDAHLLVSALPDEHGIALIAGTGSIALAINPDGQTIRAGGWGHILGDEGSGFALGQQALQAAVRAADRRGQQTLLLASILEQLQLKQAEDLIGVVYAQEDKVLVARLSSCVLGTAQKGDELAKQILVRGAYELALAVSTVYQRLDPPPNPLSLALGGGLLLHEQYYRSLLLKQVAEILPPMCSLGEIVLIDEPALSAARAAISLS